VKEGGSWASRDVVGAEAGAGGAGAGGAGAGAGGAGAGTGTGAIEAAVGLMLHLL